MKQAKVKNVERNETGDKLGRIHMKKQNLDDLGGRKMTALRGRGIKRSSSANDGSVSNSEAPKKKLKAAKSSTSF